MYILNEGTYVLIWLRELKQELLEKGKGVEKKDLNIVKRKKKDFEYCKRKEDLGTERFQNSGFSKGRWVPHEKRKRGSITHQSPRVFFILSQAQATVVGEKHHSIDHKQMESKKGKAAIITPRR